MQKIPLRPDQAALLKQAKERTEAMSVGYASGMRDSLAVMLQIISAIPAPTPKEAPPDGTQNSENP